MRVLLLGATGFIGSGLRARLGCEGIGVVAVCRARSAACDSLQTKTLVMDIGRATAADWRPHLGGIDAVVNCAGILQESPGESARAVHADGLEVLFKACEAAGIRRVIHLSAIGVDRGALSDFSRTKAMGDVLLMDRDLDWVILRPSVVTGRAAYGGSALFRGLAALPLLPLPPQAGLLQIVQLDDLLDTIVFFLRPEAPARVTLEIVGPERLSLAQVVGHYRRWLGWREAWQFRLPNWLATMLYRLGDIAGYLGWKPPMRSSARRELVRGAIGDPESWRRMTGIAPQSLNDALSGAPVSVQDRWFARLYFLKPVVLAVFASFWLATGIVSLTGGYRVGVSYMQEAGAGWLTAPSVVAGALADIAIGLGIAWRRSTRIALYGALAISLFYAVAGTILLPRLWLDPLGPMLKIWPILALNLVALAIREDR